MIRTSCMCNTVCNTFLQGETNEMSQTATGTPLSGYTGHVLATLSAREARLRGQRRCFRRGMSRSGVGLSAAISHLTTVDTESVALRTTNHCYTGEHTTQERLTALLLALSLLIEAIFRDKFRIC